MKTMNNDGNQQESWPSSQNNKTQQNKSTMLSLTADSDDVDFFLRKTSSGLLLLTDGLPLVFLHSSTWTKSNCPSMIFRFLENYVV